MASDATDNCIMFNSYINDIEYRLPFEGKWKVYWGGCKKKDNPHHSKLVAQKYAYDVSKINRAGKYYKNKGKKLGDYYSYGQVVKAPAAGIVVAVVNGVDDSPVGKPDPYFVPGNVVVINHGGKEYSLFAHLKKNSIVVKEGTKVNRGDDLAKVGNSGNSTFPHLHFQVADSKLLYESQSLPIIFRNIIVNGKNEDEYRPVKGDVIRNQ